MDLPVTEDDLQPCHRFESDAATESEPKACSEDLAMTSVLAQPEQERADEIFEYSAYLRIRKSRRTVLRCLIICS